MKEEKALLEKIDRLSDTYSDRFLMGTKIGMAIMRVLGIRRANYSVCTPAEYGKGKGWCPTKIYLKDYNDNTLNVKIIKYRKIFAHCGFNVNIHVYDGKLFLIGIQETNKESAKIQIIRRVSGGETTWQTIYETKDYIYK